MDVYFWYYWYKLVDFLKNLKKNIINKSEKIKYQLYLKSCHRYMKKRYLPMIDRLMETPFFDRLDTSGAVIIAHKDNIPNIIKTFKTEGKSLVIPEDVYEFIKDNVVGFDKEQLEAELEEVLGKEKQLS